MITFVCGFPRTGTSLLMQMLHAAGLNCAGRWPDFELASWVPGVGDSEVFSEHDALKWLEPHKAVVDAPECRVIATTRDLDERCKSFHKYYLNVLGEKLNRREMRRIKVGYRKEEPLFWKRVGRLSRSILVVRFESVIADPLTAARAVAGFVGQGEPETMARVVRERSAGCLEGMLEMELIGER